ncbi:hypothetical protein BASA60_010334 [Batrachochytrium salamandrivorans]|nr:hypothetical protein BASA60_010334 [Batrachochytrium salamandrivorans]
MGLDGNRCVHLCSVSVVVVPQIAQITSGMVASSVSLAAQTLNNGHIVARLNCSRWVSRELQSSRSYSGARGSRFETLQSVSFQMHPMAKQL